MMTTKKNPVKAMTVKVSKTPAIQMPTRNNLKEDGDAVLGIWADRPESGAEIARKLRDSSNDRNKFRNRD